MARPRRIEGYAIVSREGMICAADGVMPAALKIDADQRFFHAGVERADAVANGRHSNEGGPDAAERPRLVLTHRVPALAAHPKNPKALLWNPAGCPLEQACERLGVDGTLAVVGGTDVFGLFLTIGYDDFFLSRADAAVPGGRPVFPEVPAKTPEAVLRDHGMVQKSVSVLDPGAGVTLEHWVKST
jgi:dihydrofolate reductase